MASLRYSQIRVHPEATINYIANAEKMLSPKSHDVHNVLSYMGDEGSIERVYSYAHNCSTNPELAATQIELCRAQYYESKSGGVQGLRKGQNELLGLHFFISYSEDDNPNEETMNAITADFLDHPLLNNFPGFAANHFDKNHRHTHVFLSQYSACGIPKKMCMRHNDYNSLRKHLNHLCVSHNLSIIDLPALRYNDPEYSAWIDGVIAAGKITIHPESKEHRGSKRQKISTQELYYKRMKEKEENMQLEERRLTAAQLKAKRAKERYYWSIEGNPKTQPYFESGTSKKRYYAVTQYDQTGRKRTLVELICILIITIYRSEMQKHAPPTSMTGQVIQARVDRNVQAMMDSIRLSREMHINTPEDVAQRLSDVGRQMNGLKAEVRRLEASVQNSEPREGESLEQLQARQQFQIKKLADYERRMIELRRQYRGLKKLQALITHGDRIAEQSYLYRPNVSLDDYINLTEQKKRIASEALSKAKSTEKLSKEE